MKQSFFLTLEGIEGAGKSTLRGKLAERFSEDSREVVVTREPGATPFGQSIRNIVLDPQNRDLHSLAELMLFQADRAQHLAQVIRPALERGAIVICDRYIHSTLAYQGYGRGIDLERLTQLSDFITGELQPDLTLLLDIDPQLGIERARNRVRKSSSSFLVKNFAANPQGAPALDRFEEQSLEFHQRVRKGFLELAADSRNRFAILDGSQEPDVIAEQALGVVVEYQKTGKISSKFAGK